jgi:hypothetical protein
VNGSAPESRAFRPAFVAAVSTASAVAAWVFFRTGFRGVIYDSFHYLTLGRIVSSEGLWNLASRVRSYGYPLFIASATGFSDVPDETARRLIFAAQLLIHLVTAFYAARVAERVFGTPPFFYGTFSVLAANPFALIHSTELLSDSLSASLLALAFFSSLGTSGPGRRSFLAFLWAGLAVAVRPANAVVLPALAILWRFGGFSIERGSCARFFPRRRRSRSPSSRRSRRICGGTGPGRPFPWRGSTGTRSAGECRS